jgi:SAM-dependent methyltransferase
MTDFSRTLIARSGYEGEGFAEVYDRFRPAPPRELLDVLMLVAGVERFQCVVDVGAGTGLSTRVWADRAHTVFGVEPNPAMVDQARLATDVPNIAYVEGFAHATGLEPESADIVTCSQAFHWMEPQPVLAEAARILRPGGIFAAFDYDVPTVVEPEVDAAFAEHFEARAAARKRLDLEAGAASWPKEHHLDQIRASGRFRFARELLCHGMDETDAERTVGRAESMGGPRALFDGREPEVDETFERLRETAERVLGTATWPMVVCYRLRVGVK